MSFQKIFTLMSVFMMTFGASVVLAAEDVAVAKGDPYSSLAAAIAIGLAAFGGALGQAKTASTALEGIARNPAAQTKLFMPMIIGLVLIESLVLYAFVIAFIKIKT